MVGGQMMGLSTNGLRALAVVLLGHTISPNCTEYTNPLVEIMSGMLYSHIEISFFTPTSAIALQPMKLRCR